jgi:hypothetical protein
MSMSVGEANLVLNLDGGQVHARKTLGITPSPWIRVLLVGIWIEAKHPGSKRR